MRGFATALVLMAMALAWGCKDDSVSERGDGGLTSGGSGDGGGDAGGGSDAGSGVAGDKRLGELTADETVEICESLRSTVDTEDTRRGTCVLAASFAVGGSTLETAAEVCQTQLDACLEVPAEPCGAMMFTEDCETTVDELTACLRTAAEHFSKLAEQTCVDILENAAEAGDGGVSSELGGELDTCSAMLNACSASDENECCTDDDACGYGGDGFCDCPEQSWDAADCG